MFKVGQKGVSLYLALIILALLLALALGLSAIFFGQIRIIREIGNSVTAFYAADTGIEREAFEGNPPGTSYSDYLDLNKNGLQDERDSFYTVSILFPGEKGCPSESTFCITSTGSFLEIKRAIQVTR